MTANIPMGEFNMNAVGGPLVDEHGAINLSFLRLVGISKGGVSFRLKGVYSKKQLDSLQSQYANAFDLLYSDFIKPENRAVIVSTQVY